MSTTHNKPTIYFYGRDEGKAMPSAEREREWRSHAFWQRGRERERVAKPLAEDITFGDL